MDKSDAIKELASTGTRADGGKHLNAKCCLLIFARSFVIAALIFLVTAIILPPAYEGVDDVHMNMIASGVGLCQQPDPHIVFGHFFWGKALVWLYSCNGDLPWYGMSICLAHIFSLALVVSVFTWERASAARRALLLILYVFSLLPLWTNFDFTSAAVFLAAAASLVVFSTLEAGIYSRSGKAAAVTLATLAMVCASLLRCNAAYMAVALLAGLICCRFVTLKFSLTDGVLKRLVGSKFAAGLLIAACMFCFVHGLNAVNRAFYAQDPRWLEFEQTRPTMVKICDYGQGVYSEKTKPLLDALNWTQSDLELFQNYYYPIDPTLFSFEKAKTLASESLNVRSDMGVEMVVEQLMKFIVSPFVLPGIILALILLPLANTRIISRRRQIAGMAMFFGMLAFLLIFMKLVLRITLPLSAWALLLAIYYCDVSKLNSVRSVISTYLSAIPFASLIRRRQLFANSRRIGLLAASILVVAAVSVIGFCGARCYELASARQPFKDSLAVVQRLNGTLYIAPSFVPFALVSPFESPRNYFGNMALLVPYFASAPLRDVEKLVIKDTLLPFLEDGVYAFSGGWVNFRLEKYYWDHHRLRVWFKPCYKNFFMKVYKAEVQNAPTNKPK